MKILHGVFPSTSGETLRCRSPGDFNKYNVHRAHAPGIETVYQDSSLGEKQALWRNFFIGREILPPFGFIDVKKEKAIANEIMVNTIGFRGKGITVDSKVSKLSGGERQGVAIGRAMHFEADLDHPRRANRCPLPEGGAQGAQLRAQDTFFGAYIVGSLEAGVVATGIGGYWVHMVEGLVMAASIVLNVVIEEGGIGRFSARIRHWVRP